MQTVATKERPILFSGPMVKAILAGRKTQTRRMVKPQPPSKEWLIKVKHTGQDVSLCNEDGKWRMVGAVGVCRDAMGDKWPKHHEWKCPYGQAGDRLWVRETFCRSRNNTFYRADFAAFEKPNELSDSWDWDQGSGEQWTPSIHMKRCYSRLTLEVTGVKVERLHDISNEDIIAEGFEATSDPKAMPDGSVAQVGRFEGKLSTLRQLFSMKWDEINGAGAWSANPWVWCVSFKRVQ